MAKSTRFEITLVPRTMLELGPSRHLRGRALAFAGACCFTRNLIFVSEEWQARGWHGRISDTEEGIAYFNSPKGDAELCRAVGETSISEEPEASLDAR